MAWNNHRTTLPQSALRAASSLREGAGKRPPQCQSPAHWVFRQRAGVFGVLCGGIFSIQPGTCETVGVAGDFHRPYEALKILAFTIQRTTLPQSRPFGRASSLREGAGDGWFHSPDCSLKSGVSGDFHRPYGGRVPFNVLCALFEGGYGFCMVKIWMGFWAVSRW